MTNKGYIKRVPASAYKQQRRGGKGVTGVKMKEEDGVDDILTAHSHDTLLFFTSTGRVYSQKAYYIPEAARAGRGTLVQSFLALQPGERITAIVPVRSFNMQGYFVLATRRGRIKRVHLDEFAGVRPSGVIAMSLEEDDQMCWAKYTDGDQDIILATAKGQSIRFHEHRVRAMGRQAGGVLSMKLAKDDYIIGMDTVDADDTHVLVVTQRGYSKRTPLEEYRTRGRNGVGIRTLDLTDKTGLVVAMRCINPKDDILVLTAEGIVLRSNLEQIRDTGRIAQGVKLIDLSDNDYVVGVAIIESAPDASNGSAGGALPETMLG
jgi:DNA gyrase subunit A